METAGIGEGRTVPVHEFGKTAGFVEHLLTGAFIQVKRVGQQALCAEVLHGFGQHGFHRGLRGHGHERRSVNIAVGGMNGTGAAVSCAAASLAVGRVGKAGFLLEIEGVAAARLAWFRSTRMFDEVFDWCRHVRCGCCRGFVRRRIDLWFVQACHAFNCMR